MGKWKSFHHFPLHCPRLFFALKAKRQSRARTFDCVALDLGRFCPFTGIEEGTGTRQYKGKVFTIFLCIALVYSYLCRLKEKTDQSTC